ncbi:BrnT family toxin [candidate division WOR-3 bacterium]|nr:BrnT family toxin [candidate division WOR-3 bacterium]
MVFEWNEEKAVANVRKHGVTFHEAATVFGDPLAATFADPDHSVSEQRYLTFGVSRFDRRLVVAHADYGRRVRIVSARLMTRPEKRIYEEG